MDSTNMTTVSTDYTTSTPIQPNTNKIDVEKLQGAVDTLRKYIYQHSKDLAQEETAILTENQVSKTPELQLADQPLMQNDTLMEESALTYDAGAQPAVSASNEQQLLEESPVIQETPVIQEAQPVQESPVIPETPVIPEAQPVQESPVIQETPVIPEAQPIQEIPVIENPVAPVAPIESINSTQISQPTEIAQPVAQTIENEQPVQPIAQEAPIQESVATESFGLENPINPPVSNTNENELTISEVDSLRESADSIGMNVNNPVTPDQPIQQSTVTEDPNLYSVPEVMAMPPLESVIANEENKSADAGYVATSNSATVNQSAAPIPTNDIPVIMPDGQSVETAQVADSMVTTPQSFGMM